MKFGRKVLSTDVQNILLLSTKVLLGAMQVVLISAWILGFFPLQNPLAENVFREWMPIIRPEREVILFRIFVLVAILGELIVLNVFRKRLSDPKLKKNLQSFVLAEAVLTFLILSALFKTVIYDDRPRLAEIAYWVLLILAGLNKIFWRQFKNFGRTLYEFLMNDRNALIFQKLTAFGFPIVIFLLLYLPDCEAVMARMFIGEQFHHYDSFIMAPAWAYTSGNILNIDQISQYGVGLPVVISQLTKLLGGFSYLNVFLVIHWGCLIYFLIWFWLLRSWYKSILMAVVTMLVGIRIQMFHTGVFPFIFALPSATAIRYWFDALFFVCMFLHIRKSKNVFLWLAALTAGAATFYMFSTGIYLVFCIYAYLLAHLLIPRWRGIVYSSLKDVVPLVGYGVVALGSCFFLTWLVVGNHLFTAEYWHNMNEFLQYFVSGAGAMPFFGSLKEGNSFANAIGNFLPAFYVFSMLGIFSLCFFKKLERESLLVILLCVNGLGLNQYYVMLSAITSYYTTGLPFIFVIGYWVHLALKAFEPLRRKQIFLVLIVLSIYALVTNHNYLAYPNLLSLSRNPLLDRLVAQRLPDGRPYFNHLHQQYNETVKVAKNSLGETFEDLRSEEDFSSHEELKEYYREEFDFTEDASLIQKLTSPKEKVALLSSFDIKILMQSNRPPFFYHFPMVISRPMRLRMFGVTGMYTTEYLKKTINQLETAKPEFVFMERLYMAPEVPRYYYFMTPSFMELLAYVRGHYAVYADGKYLVAMRRVGE